MSISEDEKKVRDEMIEALFVRNTPALDISIRIAEHGIENGSDDAFKKGVLGALKELRKIAQELRV